MLPIDVPEAPLPRLVQEVNIHNPVNDDDLAEAHLHLTRVVRRRLENDINVTNTHVADAARFSHQVVQALHPVETVPVYFQEFAAQVFDRMDRLTAELNHLVTLAEQIGPLRAELQELSTLVAQIGPPRVEVATTETKFAATTRK